MYYEKYLSLIQKLANKEWASEREKINTVYKVRDDMLLIMNFMDCVIDVKLGNSELNSQEEYDEEISKTKKAVFELNEIYQKYMSEKLFDTNNLTTSKMYDISSEIYQEMKERLDKYND